MKYKEVARIIKEYAEQLEKTDGDIHDLVLKHENRDGVITIKVQPK